MLQNELTEPATHAGPAQGKVIARVEGEPNNAKINEVEKAVRSTK